MTSWQALVAIAPIGVQNKPHASPKSSVWSLYHALNFVQQRRADNPQPVALPRRPRTASLFDPLFFVATLQRSLAIFPLDEDRQARKQN